MTINANADPDPGFQGMGNGHATPDFREPRVGYPVCDQSGEPAGMCVGFEDGLYLIQEPDGTITRAGRGCYFDSEDAPAVRAEYEWQWDRPRHYGPPATRRTPAYQEAITALEAQRRAGLRAEWLAWRNWLRRLWR